MGLLTSHAMVIFKLESISEFSFLLIDVIHLKSFPVIKFGVGSENSNLRPSRG